MQTHKNENKKQAKKDNKYPKHNKKFHKLQEITYVLANYSRA